MVSTPTAVDRTALSEAGSAIGTPSHVPPLALDSEPAEQHNRPGRKPENQVSDLCYRHGVPQPRV